MEERLVKGVLQSNTTVRLQVAEELLTFLSDPSSSLTGFEDLDQVVEGLVAWLGSSHFKVTRMGRVDVLEKRFLLRTPF